MNDGAGELSVLLDVQLLHLNSLHMSFLLQNLAVDCKALDVSRYTHMR